MFLFVVTTNSLRQLSFHEELLKLVQVSSSHILYQDSKTILISDLPSVRNKSFISIWISGNPDHSIKNVSEALISDGWDRFGSRFQFNKTSGYWKLETDLTGVFSPSFLRLNGAFLMADDHKVFLQLGVPRLRENPNWLADIIISGYPHDNTSILLPLERAPANSVMEGEFEIIQSMYRQTAINSFAVALSNNETIERAKTEMQNILGTHQYDNVGLQLTGGYDTRLILASLLRISALPKTFIYGASDNYNSNIARKLAQSLNINHTFIPLDTEFEKLFPTLLLEAAIKSGGISSPSHTHIYYAANLVSTEVRCLISGMAGGELHRGFNDEAPVMPWILGNIVRNGEKANVIDNSKSFVNQVFPELQQLISSRIKTLTCKWKSECDKGLLPEIILRNAYGGFFKSVIILENIHLRTIYPFLDPRYLKVILRSPFGLVHGKNMHACFIDKLNSQRNLVKEYYPGPTTIFESTTDKGFPPNYLFLPVKWPLIPFLVFRSRRFRANLGELNNAKWLKSAYKEYEDIFKTFLPDLNKNNFDRWINESSPETKKVMISRMLHIALARYAINTLRQ